MQGYDHQDGQYPQIEMEGMDDEEGIDQYQEKYD